LLGKTHKLETLWIHWLSLPWLRHSTVLHLELQRKTRRAICGFFVFKSL
jgi:hypothetical protein